MNRNEIVVGATAASVAVVAAQDDRPSINARELLELHRTALVIGLNGSAIEQMVIEYAGSGDEGNGFEISVTPSSVVIDDLLIETADSEYYEMEPGTYRYKVSKGSMDLSSLLEEMCDLALTVGGHSGYEDNEGGYGSLTFTMATGELKLVHNDYASKVETTEHDFGSGLLVDAGIQPDPSLLTGDAYGGGPDGQAAH